MVKKKVVFKCVLKDIRSRVRIFMGEVQHPDQPTAFPPAPGRAHAKSWKVNSLTHALFVEMI